MCVISFSRIFWHILLSPHFALLDAGIAIFAVVGVVVSVDNLFQNRMDISHFKFVALEASAASILAYVAVILVMLRALKSASHYSRHARVIAVRLCHCVEEHHPTQTVLVFKCPIFVCAHQAVMFQLMKVLVATGTFVPLSWLILAASDVLGLCLTEFRRYTYFLGLIFLPLALGLMLLLNEAAITHLRAFSARQVRFCATILFMTLAVSNRLMYSAVLSGILVAPRTHYPTKSSSEKHVR